MTSYCQEHECENVLFRQDSGLDTEAAPPVRLVRLWPDHFSSRPDYNITCSVVTHNLLICRLGNGICFSS